MKENIGYEFEEGIEIRSRITFSGKCELKSTSGVGNKILTILCNDDNFKFNIGTEDDTWIILRDFEVDDEEGTQLFMRVFYKMDEEENKRIDQVIRILRSM